MGTKEQFDIGPVANDKGSIVRLPVHSELVSLLRNLIFEGEITQDDQLSERALCERFGVSRSPMREAIKAIAAEGLLENVPNCGVKLVKLSSLQIMELTQIIAILEKSAAETACISASDADIAFIGELHFRMARFYALKDWPNYFKANAEIHHRIIDAAGNASLSEFYRSLDAKIRTFRYQFHFVLEADEDHDASVERSFADHVEIFQAISDRDGPRLKAALEHHYDIKPKYLTYWENLQNRRLGDG